MKKWTAFCLALMSSLSLTASVGAEEADSRARLADLLEKGRGFYASVQNYRAVFEKQERASGKLQEKEIIFLKFEKPFKIFMGWLNTGKQGLQVVYERGKHEGKLAIHKPGLGFGLLPVIFLDQNSPWVKVGSETYDIEDAGIGTFLTDFTKAVSKAQAADQLKVGFLKSGSPGELPTAEVIFNGSNERSGYFAYRVIVSFDPDTALPIQMRLFDWNNQLTGAYAYKNLKINLAPEDAEFKRQINRQLYRVYQGK